MEAGVIEKVNESLSLALAKGEEKASVSIDLVDVLKDARDEWLSAFADVGKVTLDLSLDILKKTKLALETQVNGVGIVIKGTLVKISFEVNENALLNVANVVSKQLRVVFSSFRAYFSHATEVESAVYCTYGRGALSAVVTTIINIIMANLVSLIEK
ncbi:MAG: hypothetical protein GXO07_02755 [Crenarchaeota archaeon]|nr:hypothetical protein [Thermoproteota archaeon]